MKPLQIWLPRLGRSIKFAETTRDAVRAFEVWRDELVVWMMPGIPNARRWRSFGFEQLAIPAEEFDRIDIVHVNEKGRIYAPTNRDLPASIDGLLDSWLNAQKTGGAKFVPAPESIEVEVPQFDEKQEVSWRQETISFGPGAFMPFTSVDRETGTTEMFWPPEGFPSPVSPEAESFERFPSQRLGSDPPTVITEQGHVALHVFLRWNRPLKPIMPLLGAQDDLLAQAQMARLAARSAKDLPGALRLALVEARPYLSQGHSTLEHTWFRPALKQNGLKHVLFKAEDRGLTVPRELRQRWDENALKEAVKQDTWRKWLTEPVSIRRAWGAAGLFWTLLIDRLEEQRPFMVCERCDRIITGKAGKRFCNGSDDRECFQRRRTEDQRRSRLGRSS